MKLFDCVVIGAGPAGASAALYLARAGVNVAMVEKLATGGMLLQTAELENYPGFPKGVKGYEMADYLDAHLADYHVDRFSEEVKEVDLKSEPKRVLIGDEWVTAKAVVFATGVKYRKLGLPDEGKYLGKGYSHCALCDGNFFRDQVVGVVGGGNAALEESLYLSRIAKEVHLFVRRDQFRGQQVFQDKVLATSNIVVERSTVISNLHGEATLEGATVKRLHTGEEEFIPLQGLFVFVGFDPVRDAVPSEIESDKKGFIITDCEMRTNIPGVFAAGDIRSKLCRQVATAVGDGVTAANSVQTYLESEYE